MNWHQIPREDQETIILIDYEDRKIALFTNRKNVAEKLFKKIGEPTRTDYHKESICSVEYRLDLADKRSNVLLSKSITIAGFSKSTP